MLYTFIFIIILMNLRKKCILKNNNNLKNLTVPSILTFCSYTVCMNPHHHFETYVCKVPFIELYTYEVNILHKLRHIILTFFLTFFFRFICTDRNFLRHHTTESATASAHRNPHCFPLLELSLPMFGAGYGS
jgi:hypothetical protein